MCSISKSANSMMKRKDACEDKEDAFTDVDDGRV